MKRRYKNQCDQDSDWQDFFCGLASFYLLCLILLWFTDRIGFWHWTIYGAAAAAILFAGIKIGRKAKERAGREKKGHIHNAA